MPKIKVIDEICGIDRYEISPCRGELVVKHVNVWDKPGGKLIALLDHGDAAEIIEKKIHRKIKLYIKIKSGDTSGWVPAELLRDAGLLRPGIKAIE